MFSKKRRREPAITTLIGAETRVHGDLEFAGGCLVVGYVMGNVRSIGGDDSMLSVSDRGCIEGTIEVPNVVLDGTVKGDVRASQRVELGRNAKVHGNVEYGLIEMAIGAKVNGKLVHASESGLVETAGSRSATIASDEELPPDGGVNVVGEST